MLIKTCATLLLFLLATAAASADRLVYLMEPSYANFVSFRFELVDASYSATLEAGDQGAYLAQGQLDARSVQALWSGLDRHQVWTVIPEPEDPELPDGVSYTLSVEQGDRRRSFAFGSGTGDVTEALLQFLDTTVVGESFSGLLDRIKR